MILLTQINVSQSVCEELKEKVKLFSGENTLT